MNDFQASREWAMRPDDERFWTMDELIAEKQLVREESTVIEVPHIRLAVAPREERVVLEDYETGAEMNLTHHSFGQICTLAGAPGHYMRRKLPELVAQCLNDDLLKLNDTTVRSLLVRRAVGSTGTLRAITSTQYGRLWDAEIAKGLLPLQERGWRVPPGRPNGYTRRTRLATQEDVLDTQGFLSVQVGDTICPSGIYGSDHDMFIFMVNQDREIQIPGCDIPLYRGFFVIHSEVGCRAFWLVTFLFNHVCGNHIIWGIEQKTEIKVVHRGDVDQIYNKVFTGLTDQVNEWGDRVASEDEKLIGRAQRHQIGTQKEDVIEELFNKGIASKKILSAGIAAAVEHPDDAGPWTGCLSYLGVAQGLTRLSQQSRYADRREVIDRAAGKVLALTP